MRYCHSYEEVITSNVIFIFPVKNKHDWRQTKNKILLEFSVLLPGQSLMSSDQGVFGLSHVPYFKSDGASLGKLVSFQFLPYAGYLCPSYMLCDQKRLQASCSEAMSHRSEQSVRGLGEAICIKHIPEFHSTYKACVFACRTGSPTCLSAFKWCLEV